MKTPTTLPAILFALALVASGAASGQSRDRIRIVGSSTVFPYSQAVSEHYARMSHARAPVVEATGTGGGMKIFCAGVGPAFPDITGASRRIADAEYRDCRSNGVTEITELLLGHDGISIAQSRDAPPLRLTKAQIFQALAAEVEVAGAIVQNPYRRWNEIDPALPDMPIQVLGPPPTSGTRDEIVDLALHPGCAAFPVIAALDPGQRERVCSRIRQDGAYLESGEDDNLVVRRLKADPMAVGIFGFPFLYENRDTLWGIPVDGVAPGRTAIAEGRYPLSRPLYLYVKRGDPRELPELRDLLGEYVSEDALGPEGYLLDRGLVPLSRMMRIEMRERVARGETLAAPTY